MRCAVVVLAAGVSPVENDEVGLSGHGAWGLSRYTQAAGRDEYRRAALSTVGGTLLAGVGEPEQSGHRDRVKGCVWSDGGRLAVGTEDGERALSPHSPHGCLAQPL